MYVNINMNKRLRVFQSFKNQFLLIRHAESIYNKRDKFTGWTNIPLSENGINESKKIGNKIKELGYKPTIIFSSVLKRSIDTSQIIKDVLNNNAEMHTSWRLNEKHYGTLEGLDRQFIYKNYGDKFTDLIRNDFHAKPPVVKGIDVYKEYPVYRNCYIDKLKYGESKENVLARLLPYFENDILSTLHETNLPLIVTHKHCARVLLKHLQNIPDHEFDQLQFPSKKICLVDLDTDFKYNYHKFYDYMDK